MSRIIFCIISAIIFFSLAEPLFAVDEGVYVQFAADSIITLHRLKGSPRALDLWMEEMQEKYPNHTDRDWQLFGERLKKDRTLKDRVYNRILENIKSKGYNARIIKHPDGLTTIEIMGD